MGHPEFKTALQLLVQIKDAILQQLVVKIVYSCLYDKFQR